MTPNSNLLLLSALALAATSSLLPGTPAAAQDKDVAHERQVFVWRGDGEHLVELEAGLSRRGFLGVTLLDLTPELRRHFGVPSDRGIMVSRVLGESPAERAGLRPADILTSVDGSPLPAGLHLSMSVAKAKEGEPIELEYFRDGRTSSVAIDLDLRERSQFDISPIIQHRVNIRSPRVLEIHRGLHGEPEDDGEWIEKVVGSVGERFIESSFLEQLQAMSRERSELQAKLLLMEERLVELEKELQRLDRDDR